MEFPGRVYTREEVKKAKELVENGYKHNLIIHGSQNFKQKVETALKLVEIAGYYDFVRTYIRSIIEIDGLTQLRESESSIWANKYAVENVVDAASFFVQKAFHMKEYIDGKLYYGGGAERRSIEKRIEFLKTLKQKSNEQNVKEECERLLNLWKEHSLVY